MEFSTDDARMWYDADTGTITMEGKFRLNTDQYASVAEIFDKVLATDADRLRLDLTGLEFLNSSGINVIAKFVIVLRNGKKVALTVKGNRGIPWQTKSLPNLKKLHGGVELVMD